MKTLSNQELKNIKRYQLKKYRMQDKKFLAEGKKTVSEITTSQLKIKVIIISEDYQEKDNIPNIDAFDTRICTQEQFKKISTQKTPDGILAVCEIPQQQLTLDKNEWVVALDSLQDPGNLGTIIRIADWFNISTIICNKGTVDAYNPKVIQATMGSIGRVNVVYTNLVELLKNYNGEIYGATLHGESIYTSTKNRKGVLVIGNESKGISDEMLKLITKEVTIPRLGLAESLNAGVATAILVSHFKKE